MRRNGVLKESAQGFTLIEVVLVLAIGGLIFLLAFLSFRQVTVNRRDTQRRNDGNRLLAELQNWSADRNGALPPINVTSGYTDALCDPASTPTNQFNQFVKSNMCAPAFNDPQGNPYRLVAHATAETQFNTNGQLASRTIQYTIGNGATDRFNCDGTTVLGVNQVRIRMWLEKGTYCKAEQL